MANRCQANACAMLGSPLIPNHPLNETVKSVRSPQADSPPVPFKKSWPTRAVKRRSGGSLASPNAQKNLESRSGTPTVGRQDRRSGSRSSSSLATERDVVRQRFGRRSRRELGVTLVPQCCQAHRATTNAAGSVISDRLRRLGRGFHLLRSIGSKRRRLAALSLSSRLGRRAAGVVTAPSRWQHEAD